MNALPLMLTLFVATGPHLTPQQVSGIGADFCQRMGSPVTAVPKAEYDPPGHQPFAFWLPCWKVSFPGQADLAIVDSSGVVCRYTNDALEAQTGDLPAGPAIPEEQAVQASRAALQAAHAPLGELTLSHALLNKPRANRGVPVQSGHYYLVMWDRVAGGIPYYGQGAVVEVQAETGQILGFNVTLPTPPPTSMQIGVDAEHAAELAAAELDASDLGATRWLHDAALTRAELKVVQPTTFWEDQDRVPHTGTSRLAWDCWLQGDPMYARVFIDAANGAVIGGDVGGPGGVGPRTGGFFLPALQKAKEVKLYVRDEKLEWGKDPLKTFSHDAASGATDGGAKLFEILAKAQPVTTGPGITIPTCKLVIQAERPEPYELLYVPGKNLVGQPGEWYQLSESLEDATGIFLPKSLPVQPAGAKPLTANPVDTPKPAGTK